MLPEWHAQLAIIITWPHQYSDWHSMLDTIEACYIDIALAITESQKLLIIAYNQSHQENIIKKLNNNKINITNISFVIIPTNDTWVRDYGPITVGNKHNNQLIWQDFEFNAWGGKFDSQLDNSVNKKLIKHEWFNENYLLEKQNYILEGGSIEVNSHGDLLTTASCIDNTNRNNANGKNINRKNINRKNIKLQQKEMFENILGSKNIYKLNHGTLSGDDTDGHIDTLVRFMNDNLVCYVGCNNKLDEHYLSLSKMKKEIDSLPFDAISLPMPEAQYNKNNYRLPATYANFLITNYNILVPIYNCKQDNIALDIFKNCFKNKNIIPIDCSALIYQHGSLHCSTMQVPLLSTTENINKNTSESYI